MSGGLLLVLLSVFGLIRHGEPLFTDNVIGVILILIAITLLPYLAPMAIGKQGGYPHGDPSVFGISVLVIVLIAVLSNWLTGFLKTVSIFLGIIIGTLLMWALGRMDVSGVKEAYWFSLPQPFFPGLPRFSISSTITFLVAYVAVIINGVGSIYSIGEVVGREGMASRVNRGIGFTGFGGLMAGALGVMGTVSYSLSPGVVLVTRVGSRFAVTVCGVFLLSLAFFSKIPGHVSVVPGICGGGCHDHSDGGPDRGWNLGYHTTWKGSRWTRLYGYWDSHTHGRDRLHSPGSLF